MPFGKGYLCLKIPERNLQKVYSLNEPPSLMDEEKELRILSKASPFPLLLVARIRYVSFLVILLDQYQMIGYLQLF